MSKAGDWLKEKEIATWRTAVSALRMEYTGEELSEEKIGQDPFAAFEHWFAEAVKHAKYDPNAMVLSTVRDGQPSGRVVLLKGFDERGFVFYTNYESDKGQALAETPAAALTFHWAELFRQVRIEGKVVKLSDEESSAYFHSRPRESRLSAMVSPQSQRIASRQELLDLMEALKKRYDGVEELQKPDDWGGFRVVPARIEFWQGRTNRLHDRIVFERESLDGSDTGSDSERKESSSPQKQWERYRLAP